MTEKEAILRWAQGLATLLDRIEQVSDDEEAVLKLCSQRLDLAELCGFRIEYLGLVSGEGDMQ